MIHRKKDNFLRIKATRDSAHSDTLASNNGIIPCLTLPDRAQEQRHHIPWERKGANIGNPHEPRRLAG